MGDSNQNRSEAVDYETIKERESVNPNEMDQSSNNELVQCSICGEKHVRSIMHGFEVKGKKKYICQGCADTVHGLV
jgi:transposase-like protein